MAHINIELAQYEITGSTCTTAIRTLDAQEGPQHRTGLLERDEGGAGVYRIGSTGRGGLKLLPFFSPSSIS
jgi:hypothetical protein